MRGNKERKIDWRDIGGRRNKSTEEGIEKGKKEKEEKRKRK